MKRNLFYLTLSALLTLAPLTACDDDDDDNDNATITATEGALTGYLTVSSAYFSDMLYDNGSYLNITADSAYMTCATWGYFSITDDYSLTTSGSTVTISGSGTVQMSSHSSTVSSYACTVSGTYSTDLSSGTITFSLPSVMGGTTMVYNVGSSAALATEGSYAGTATISVSGMSMGSYDYTIALAASTADAVDITFGAITYGSYTIGEFSVSDVAITANSDGSYSIADGEINATTSDDSAMTITGTFSDAVVSASGTLSMEVSITPGSMPMAIGVSFSGSIE